MLNPMIVWSCLPGFAENHLVGRAVRALGVKARTARPTLQLRRIKIRQKSLFYPLIQTFSLREKGLPALNLIAVTRRVGTRLFYRHCCINTRAVPLPDETQHGDHQPC